MKQKVYEIQKPNWDNEIWQQINRLDIDEEYSLKDVIYYKTEKGTIRIYVDLIKGWVFNYDGNKTITLSIMKSVELLKYLIDTYNEFKDNEDVWTDSVESRIKELKLLRDSKKPNGIKSITNNGRTIKVGTKLYTSWGYDQTNIETFRVVKILGKHYFIIQEVCQKTEDVQMTYSNVSPGDEDLYKLPVKAFMSKDGYMSISERGYRRALFVHNEGESHYKTNTMFGH